LADIVGTTGASVLLIRPFLRANHGRIRPLHVVFFILIVSNCGGVLTPIGDPPLYLGYLRGVPFFWELKFLWPSWLIVVGCLLIAFNVYDRWAEKQFRGSLAGQGVAAAELNPGFSVKASPLTLSLLVLIVLAVFVDPLLSTHFGLNSVPVGATLQIILAIAAFKSAHFSALERNQFTWDPVKEVGILFAGIFITMAPALAYLSHHGKSLGVDSPTAFYFATGALSAVLDNAPTYLNFLQIALTPDEVTKETILSFIATDSGRLTLEAISTGAVFFGALTYIGNGPNFMVRSIAEAAQVRMPSFFGYAMWACVILLPVLVLHWFIIFTLVR
jgi:Na+/H+ antiporter NhaD/arsenite permease-like protein